MCRSRATGRAAGYTSDSATPEPPSARVRRDDARGRHPRSHRSEPRAREAALLEEIIRDGKAQGVFAVRSPRLVAAGMTACLHDLDAHCIGPCAADLKVALEEVDEVFVRGLLAASRHCRTSET